MADLVVCAATGALKPLLKKLAAALDEECKSLKGLRVEVDSLTKELEAMHAYLLKMSEVENPGVQDKICMMEARELSYDMEDCLDEFLLRIGNKANNTPDSLISKLKSIIVTKPRTRRQIAKVIAKLKIQVKEMGERNARYKTHETVSKTSSAHVDRRALAIFDNASKLVGLDQPKEELIEHLTKVNGLVSSQQPKVISIVGPGGLGKTTLANQVYQDLKGGFECHAFVSVSRSPDSVNVLQNILCQLSNEPHPNIQAWNLQVLIMKINDTLKDKRYIVVIDDIWTKEAWEIIYCALYKNDLESKIITTTRLYDVARACCSSCGDFVYEMKPLGPADSKMLFFERLFGSKDRCPAHLTRISDKILEKCDGLPLAIISISGLLASKAPTEDEWGRVQNSIGCGLAKYSDVKSMVQILSLSYLDLPHYLRTCLLYLSVFPEDSIIDKKRLVRRWIAEGFIQKEQGQTFYKLRERCFNELINRSLIQARDIDMYGEVTACQVHDTILDFLVSKCEEDNFISVFGDGYQIIHGPDSKVRRLSFHASKEKAYALTQQDLSRVRSVTVLEYSVELPLWSRFSFLRVLDLHGCRPVEDNHLKDIGNLFQLKYLSLSKTEVCELPEDIWKLKCLETLDLRKSKVRKLPAGIAQLQGLVYLAVDKGVKLPDGTARMTALEDLDCVDIFKQSLNFPEEFRQLKNLRNVQLFLSSGNCSGENHYKEYMNDIASSLCKLSHLHSLSIDVDPKITEDFSLDSCGDAPIGLQKLEIVSHFISKVPNWVLSLLNLRSLTLYVKEFEVDDVMALGRLPALVFLRLVAHKWFHGRRVTISGADGFQSLRRFDYGCAVPVTFEAGAMPMIKKLTLMFSICKSALLVRNDEFLFPFGVRHLTSLDSVNYLLHWHRKEIDGWIAEKMAEMAHMSCEQLKATICEVEAIGQMFASEKRMENAARSLIRSPELTIRRTVKWRISIASGNRLTSAILQPNPPIHMLRDIKAQIEERIRNCPLKGKGNCKCQGYSSGKCTNDLLVID
ncbi:unnamed protein product [Urochloa humidicola]